MLKFTPVDRPSAQEVVLHLKRMHMCQPIQSYPEFVAKLLRPLPFDGLGPHDEWAPAPANVQPKRQRMRPVPIGDYIRLPFNPEITVLWVSEDGAWATTEYVEPEEEELAPKFTLPSDILRVRF